MDLTDPFSKSTMRMFRPCQRDAQQRIDEQKISAKPRLDMIDQIKAQQLLSKVDFHS